MSEKYGGVIDVSPDLPPEIIPYVEERARGAAEKAGATDRFKFEAFKCDGFINCPRWCSEEHKHTDDCDAGATKPHGHAYWTGWTE